MASIQDTYRDLTGQLAQISGAKACFVCLYESKSGMMRAQQPGYGLSNESLAAFQYPVSTLTQTWTSWKTEVLRLNNPDRIPASFKVLADGGPVESIVAVTMEVEKHIVGLLVALNKPHGFSEEDGWRMKALASLVGTQMENAHLLAKVRDQRQRMQELGQQIITTQELERKRIAQEIHDELGQRLTMLKLRMQLLSKRLPTDTLPQAKEAVVLVDAILDDVRRISHGLQPPEMSDGALVPALKLLCHDFGRFTSLAIHFEQVGKALPERIQESITVTLYRVLQEGLNNAVRHGAAHNVWVRLDYMANVLWLIIRDDGKGFNPEEERMKPGIGLDGMRERLEILGGKLIVQSQPDKGTKLVAEIPMPTNIREMKGKVKT